MTDLKKNCMELLLKMLRTFLLGAISVSGPMLGTFTLPWRFSLFLSALMIVLCCVVLCVDVIEKIQEDFLDSSSSPVPPKAETKEKSTAVWFFVFRLLACCVLLFFLLFYKYCI